MNDAKRHVVFVESDKVTLSLYRRELEPFYATSACQTEAELWHTLAQHDISAIVLEPANGNQWVWSFLGKLKTNRQTSAIPVIFCTVVDERRKGLALGAIAYFIKPVYAHVLLQFIHQL